MIRATAPKRIALSSQTGDAAAVDEVECGFEGKPTTLLFNAEYVLATLNALRADDVTIDYEISGDRFTPVVFRGVGDSKATALCMPQTAKVS